ncbi:MAG TPA: tetratricopeptide repeat protein [Bryobacteraceae bacterium]|jgi:tetratricopeptide (TPR) repeat protein|nr:tetratricopeptide repeat protein [Bryobacteraceae bacterium]
MLAELRRSALSVGFVLVATCSAWAQTATLQGDVKDQNGQPLKGAVIQLVRTDIKGHYQVKSDKKGHWLYTGLPGASTFDVSCVVDGKVVDKATGVKANYGDDNPPINFDLRKVQAQQAAAQQANAQGQPTQDQERGMSKEQKDQYEAQLKKNTEAIKKNKALNDAYNAGQTSLKAAGADTDPAKKVADYQAAIDKFNQASQMDANQPAIWDSLGEAYAGLGRAQTGDEKNKSFDQATEAYKKSLAIKPNDAAVYNQMGNIYALEKKMPEASDALTKAAQLDPTMAPKAYFNMGANLVNGGQPEKAGEYFKKATDADPNYAEAWYQYGSILMMQGKVDPKTGKQDYPPDTTTALKKYLDLQPSGPHAQEATAMLQALGQTVQTKITVPQKKSH